MPSGRYHKEMRDEFAIAALSVYANEIGSSLDYIAQRCYAMADAMLKERAKVVESGDR